MTNSDISDVAIISIFYNRENNVFDSVSSLISQTYQNLRIILVDDFSTDDTYSRLHQFKELDSRVEIVKNQFNKGFTQTLIDIINDLSVKYVAIHGAGDLSMSTRIEDQVKYLDAKPDVGLLTVDLVNSLKPRFHQEEIKLKHLLKKNRLTHGAVMFRLDDYIKAGGYRSLFTTRQDKDLWLRMSLITKVSFLNKKLYKLVNIENSVSRKASKDGLPILLSEFSIFLIKHKLKTGQDLFEVYGDKSLLFFNPAISNKQFYTFFLKSINAGDYTSSINYLDKLILINTNYFHVKFLKVLKCLVNFHHEG